MARVAAARAAIGIGVLLLTVLLALWFLRRIIGLVIRMSELIGIVAIALISVYIVYELVRGWRYTE